jgi:glycosyltransferase involved in cell wall biosynthesis
MNVQTDRLRLVVAVNSWIALGFVQGQLEFFQSAGFDVTVVCPPRRKDEWEVPRPNGIPIVEVPIEREIAPLRDLAALWGLWRMMRAVQPTVTNVGTPKAGLLGGVAAWLNRVPCRIYTLHGLRYETAKGLQRRILISAERLACRLAHRVVCVSQSVREKAIADGITTEERAVIFGAGSCNGVDASRFAATPELLRRAARLRRELGIPAHAPVALFVGRLTRDKGIAELAKAFSRVSIQYPELRLLLVGCFENGDPLPADIRCLLEAHPRVIFAGGVPDTAPYYATANVVILPSHREGLPISVLEAQAAGKPVVGAAATGIVDIVADGETGVLFPIGDAAALSEAIARVIADEEFAHKLGMAGQEQVKRKFAQELVWQALYREYSAILGLKTPPRTLLPRTEDGGGFVSASSD